MIKADEFRLMTELRARTADDRFVHVRALVAELGIPTRRAEYITKKWLNKGWYDYGVHCLAGWLTEKGRAAVLDYRE